jgi:hypothetical protein
MGPAMPLGTRSVELLHGTAHLDGVLVPMAWLLIWLDGAWDQTRPI